MAVELSIVGDQLWKKIGESMDRIEERLRKTVAIMEASGVPYAIVGGNAVRIWVAQVDPAAVRATNDVDVLIREADLDRIKDIMSQHGFRYRKAAGLDMFLEGENDSARHAVHIVFANRMIKPDDFEPNPDVEPHEYGDGICTLPLEKLVRMKLNSYRLKDRVHLLDMIQIGIIDSSWISKLPPTLGDRLQTLIENPDQ